MVNPFTSENVTSPCPGGPGNTTLTVTVPEAVLAGMSNVAVTVVLLVRVTFVPFKVPSVAEVGLSPAGGGFAPSVIVSVTFVPALAWFGVTADNAGPPPPPPGPPPIPPPLLERPVAGS